MANTTVTVAAVGCVYQVQQTHYALRGATESGDGVTTTATTDPSFDATDAASCFHDALASPSLPT